MSAWIDNQPGSLARVEVTREVLLACLNHAHSTEAEEVMGLLLGDVLVSTSGERMCRISMAFPQIRTDRRKDRVETSPTQMARCTAHAERLTAESGQPVRVIGWYHSHPHITVLPSHVDVRTQGMYQLLDPGFIGLIVSAFNRDPVTETCTVQLTAFQQSAGADGHGGAGHSTHRSIPLVIVPAATPLEQSYRDTYIAQRILFMEEKEAYARVCSGQSQYSQTPASASGSPIASSSGPTPSPRTATPSSGGPSDLALLQHGCVYGMHLVQLLDCELGPTVAAFEQLLKQQTCQLAQLGQEVEQLEAACAQLEAARRAGPAEGVLAISGGGVAPIAS